MQVIPPKGKGESPACKVISSPNLAETEAMLAISSDGVWDIRAYIVTLHEL